MQDTFMEELLSLVEQCWEELTFTAVPAEAARHVCGLYGSFLAGLQ